MADYKVTDTELTSIANAIRTRGGTSGQLVFPAGFVSAIGDIPSGGGGGGIDLSFLPNSDSTKVLCSFGGIIIPTGATGVYLPRVKLGSASANSTSYIASVRNSGTNEVFIHSRPGSKYPFFNNKTASVEYAVYAGGNTAIAGILPTESHVYAMSINTNTKAARFFCDGEYLGEKTFTSVNDTITFNGNEALGAGGFGDISILYGGVVEDLESDATIIANMQTIMTKLGINNE